MADVPKLKFEDLDGKEKEKGRLYLSAAFSMFRPVIERMERPCQPGMAVIPSVHVRTRYVRRSPS